MCVCVSVCVCACVGMGVVRVCRVHACVCTIHHGHFVLEEQAFMHVLFSFFVPCHRKHRLCLCADWQHASQPRNDYYTSRKPGPNDQGRFHHTQRPSGSAALARQPFPYTPAPCSHSRAPCGHSQPPPWEVSAPPA